MTVHLTSPPRQTTEPCVLHKWCLCKSIGNEEHHVLPQAWQLHWFPESNYGEIVALPDYDNPGSPIARGQAKPKEAIWDKRTISCDPLGHRNIHHILVAGMKVYEGFVWDEGEEETEADAELAHRKAVKQLRQQDLHINPHESMWALEAMWRWLQAGGSLIDLCLAGQYGYA